MDVALPLVKTFALVAADEPFDVRFVFGLVWSGKVLGDAVLFEVLVRLAEVFAAVVVEDGYVPTKYGYCFL